MTLSFKNFESWYFSQNFQKEGQKYLDFFVCPFRSELETSNCLFQNHGFLKIFGFEKKFWRKFQNFWPIFENFACPLRSQIWWSFLRWLLQNTNFPPSSALDPHYKVVELAEICRLRYSKVKSDVGNMVKIINFWSLKIFDFHQHPPGGVGENGKIFDPNLAFFDVHHFWKINF